MSKSRNRPKKEPEKCEHCGEFFLREGAHRTVCRVRRNRAFENQCCGMCGQQYTQYMTHITEECEGR